MAADVGQRLGSHGRRTVVMMPVVSMSAISAATTALPTAAVSKVIALVVVIVVVVVGAIDVVAGTVAGTIVIVTGRSAAAVWHVGKLYVWWNVVGRQTAQTHARVATEATA